MKSHPNTKTTCHLGHVVNAEDEMTNGSFNCLIKTHLVKNFILANKQGTRGEGEANEIHKPWKMQMEKEYLATFLYQQQLENISVKSSRRFVLSDGENVSANKLIEKM